MSTAYFLSETDDNAIVNAIAEAEKGTSGEIRVHFAKKISTTIYEDAKKTFESLKMHQTDLKNGVLIYMVLSEKQFYILGDQGIHQCTGEKFWQSCKEIMQDEFVKGNISQGIIKGIEAVKDILKKEFPYTSDDKNELSNEISKDH
jgi:uncharacterized membrane protein